MTYPNTQLYHASERCERRDLRARRMMTNLTKAEIAAVAHAAAKRMMATVVPVLQQITREMDLSGGRK